MTLEPIDFAPDKSFHYHDLVHGYVVGPDGTCEMCPRQGVVHAAIEWAAQYREEKAAIEAIPEADLFHEGEFPQNRDTPEWERFRVAARRRPVVTKYLLDAVDALPVTEP